MKMDKLKTNTLIEIEEFINTCRLLIKSKEFSSSEMDMSEQLIDTNFLNDIKTFIGQEHQSSAYDTFCKYIKEGIKVNKWHNASEFREMAEIDYLTEYNWKKGIHIPGKEKMLRIIIVLQIGIEKSQELLAKCGMTFNASDTRDIIISYFIREGISDIYKTEDYLSFWGQSILPNYK
ncbi:MAG: hypothetical protein K0S55_552 [Clostridia bacterium]|nr:hypothetical protein [Clostridia bacterium]